MYVPQVNDYVKWTTALGMVHEGGYILKEHPTIMRRESRTTGFQHLTTLRLRLQPNRDQIAT